MLASPTDLFSLSEPKVEVISEVAADSRNPLAAVPEGMRCCSVVFWLEPLATLCRSKVSLAGVGGWAWPASFRFSWISFGGFALLPCVACEIGSALETLRRRFDRRSDVLRDELRLVPIEICGAETLRPLVLLRGGLPVDGRLLLKDGPRDSVEGPADETRLLNEKVRFEAVRSGEDAAVVGIVAGVTASLTS